MRTLMVFVLITLGDDNEPLEQKYYFQELTSCLEYSVALNCQNVRSVMGVCTGPSTQRIRTYCSVIEIPASEAGSKYQFRDPSKAKVE